MNKINDEISCPSCKKKSSYNKENVYRPFCSDRCKLIDLGDWVYEKFKLAGNSEQDIKNNDLDNDSQ